MTNILLQPANMNRGAWLLTEEIIECFCDIDELFFIGGVIWGYNSDDDFYVDSHSVATPGYFWKSIISNQGYILATNGLKKAINKKLVALIISISNTDWTENKFH